MPYKPVSYQGIICRLYRGYMDEKDGSLVMSENYSDVDRSFQRGLECIGYPKRLINTSVWRVWRDMKLSQ